VAWPVRLGIGEDESKNGEEIEGNQGPEDKFAKSLKSVLREAFG
jgi:hypothetical protein